MLVRLYLFYYTSISIVFHNKNFLLDLDFSAHFYHLLLQLKKSFRMKPIVWQNYPYVIDKELFKEHLFCKCKYWFGLLWQNVIHHQKNRMKKSF